MTEETYKTRIASEVAELDDKLVKLIAFLDTQTYLDLPWSDRHLIQHQRRAMESYSRILHQRLKRATP